MSSNNTNKLSPQELLAINLCAPFGSNNTNKLSPQEHDIRSIKDFNGSNNTNKLSPQELFSIQIKQQRVQIIQINLVLKNLLNLSIDFK